MYGVLEFCGDIWILCSVARYNVFQIGFIILAGLTFVYYSIFVSSNPYLALHSYCRNLLSLFYSVTFPGMETEKAHWQVPALKLRIRLLH